MARDLASRISPNVYKVVAVGIGAVLIVEVGLRLLNPSPAIQPYGSNGNVVMVWTDIFGAVQHVCYIGRDTSNVAFDCYDRGHLWVYKTSPASLP